MVKALNIKTTTLALVMGCYFIGQLAWSQNSWEKVETLKLTQFPEPLVKEQFYRYLPSSIDKNLLSSKALVMDRILLPNEKGEEELFLLKPAPVLSPKLSATHPNVKTYKGYSEKRPEVKVRLSAHPTGFNAWIKLPNQGNLFIQPKKNSKGIHFVYQKTKNDKFQDFVCKTVQSRDSKQKTKKGSNKTSKVNNEIHIFRIAIAATAEYTTYWGDDDPSNGTNVEDAYAALVSTLNRINQIFEDELSIRLELVSDESLVYEDPEADPFTGEFATELQSTIDEVLGDDAYDVGHLFDFGEPNGDAGCIGCVCESGIKAQGYSTHPFVDIYGGEYRNDYFDLDYAAHEIGHQFGAYHTFSYTSEGTGVNAEPGSGSSIMAYAGITGPNDVQLHGDPYFHYYSIQNIKNTLDTLECAVVEPLSNESFSIDAGPNYFIPIGTAYELSINEIEGEGLTYCWEQLDDGEITTDNFGPFNKSGSTARSLLPKAVSSRFIPNMTDVLLNNLTQQNPTVGDSWETVSMVGRDLNWGLTVRKDQGDYVQLAQDRMEITIVSTSTPFAVISQDEDTVVLKGGAFQTIEWDVAETNTTPISVEQVEIYLSEDGGAEFDHVLSLDAPNIGEASIFVPNTIDTDQARLKVKAKDGIFFAVNRANFTIASRDIILKFDSYTFENCNDNSIQLNFEIERKEDFTSSFSVAISNLPSELQASYSKGSYSSNDTKGSITLSGLNDLAAGDYELDIVAQYGSVTEIFSLQLNQRESSFEIPVLLSPLDEAEGESLTPELSWEPNVNADNTKVQVALDDTFQNTVVDTLVRQNSLSLSKLDSNTNYYWRIQESNNCGISSFSEPFNFSTTVISCLEVTSSAIPKNIQDAEDNVSKGVTTASINVNYDLAIQDLDIYVDIEHTYLEDLTLYLESPEGIRYLFARQLGGDKNDYSETIFDEEAVVSIDQGTPPFTGRFSPEESIADLYGTSAFGIWTLIIEDNFPEDTGRLLDFTLAFCLEGTPLPNSDGDSIIDEEDNCPEITNEDQSDIDNNGIGDVCDIFSALNLSISKKDTSCANKSNGSISFSALADYLYKAEILGDNGYSKTLTFTIQGNGLSNLAEGVYSICITSASFSDFEYCFETQINAPEPLEVISSINALNSELNLSLAGSERYFISLNGQDLEVVSQDKITLPLNQKLNRIEVKTSKSCLGIYQKWINTSEAASVFPNPIIENANLILPDNAKVDLLLLSGSGTPLWQSDAVQSAGEAIQIPMGALNPGLYLLQVIYPERIETLKLLKR